ncbi:MAG: hypothetical protein WC250_00790 [Candidatus Paceibacterota bacterium]|jgi:hypothetical protein
MQNRNDIAAIYVLILLILTLGALDHLRTRKEIANLKAKISDMKTIVEASRFPNHIDTKKRPSYILVTHQIDYE